jgi:tetratricopeptide (TPR) repeat protein
MEASRDKAFTGYWPAYDAFLLLGQAQWQLGRFDEAARSFQSAVDLPGEGARAHHWLGVTRLSLADYPAAERSLKAALALKPDLPDALADLGVALGGQRRFDEGRGLLAVALAEGLGNARRHRAMALIMLEDGRLEDAASHLEQALAERETAPARARLAWVFWQQGRTQQARAELATALALEEQPSPYVNWVRTRIASDGVLGTDPTGRDKATGQ